MITEKELDQMMDEIEFREWLVMDPIIPAELDVSPLPPLYEVSESTPSLWESGNFSPFQIKLHKIYARYGIDSRLVCLALENAFLHGNRNNVDLPVELNIYEGDKGLVTTVKNLGEGFDYRKVTFDLRQSLTIRKNSYSQRSGQGFYEFEKPHFNPAEVSFSDYGRQVNILHLK